MKFYAKKDVNDFVVVLYTPHDEFDLAADIVEITESSYAEAMASPDEIADYKVVAGTLVLDASKQSESMLKEAKQKVYADLKSERLARIQSILPAVENDEVLEMIAELWNSIAGAAKSPTVEWQSVIDVFQAAKQAGVTVKNMTILADVENYNVKVDPIWP